MREFLKTKVWQPIMQQMKQGATPSQLALSVSLGVVLTLFPIFGTTVTLCVLFGFIFKLNQPTILAINYLLTPVQLVAIPAFIRIGEAFFKLPSMSFNPTTILHDFWTAPLAFAAIYGKSLLAGVAVWAVLLVPMAWTTYRISFPILKKVVRRR